MEKIAMASDSFGKENERTTAVKQSETTVHCKQTQMQDGGNSVLQTTRPNSQALIPYKFDETQHTLKIKRKLEKLEAMPVLNKKAIPLPPLSGWKSIGIVSAGNEVNKREMDEKRSAQITKDVVTIMPKKCSVADDYQDHQEAPLQLLSARSSTPHIQTISKATVRCDLEQSSEKVIPLKVIQVHEMNEEKIDLSISKSVPILETKIEKNLSKSKSVQNFNKSIQYTRENLLYIRKDMVYLREYPNASMMKSDALDLEARLRRLCIWRIINEHGQCVKPNNFKTRCQTDSSIIESLPPQPEYKETLVKNNHRRIGSGRIPNKFSKNQMELHGLNSKMTLSKFNEEPNENYKSKNYKNDEPEWFSCGPTSRLDTIELCGFDDDISESIFNEKGNGKDLSANEIKENLLKNSTDKDQSKQKRHHIYDYTIHKTNKKNDSNNNVKVYENESLSVNHLKEKGKGYLKKQEYQNKKYNQNDGDNDGRNNNSSRFLPLFGNKKEIENQNSFKSSKESNSTGSLNEFFKNVLSVNNIGDQKHHQIQQKGSDKNNTLNTILNIGDMPTVGQLEAKWRSNSIPNSKVSDSNKKFNNNNSCSNAASENFIKFIGQMKNYTNSSTEPNLIDLKQKEDQNKAQNLFNNENLSQFIFKQQQFYQQQKQQQAALAANIQIKAVLSRPDAQSLLLGLAKGELTKQGLLIQLANPRLPQRNREAITAVLTFTSAQLQQQNFEIFSNNLIVNQLQNLHNLALLQQSIAVQQQQQHIYNKRHTMPPSSSMTYEDLQTHANLIMQNAMMKRKLEEQNNALGLQKLLQFNVVATAAAAAVKQQLHQQQQQPVEKQPEHNILMNLLNGQIAVDSKSTQSGTRTNISFLNDNNANKIKQRCRFTELCGNQIKFASDIELQQKLQQNDQVCSNQQ